MSIDKKKIHKDSEIWNYEGQVEFTKELVDFFEEERKFLERQRKRDSRNLAFEDIELDKVQNQIRAKGLEVDKQAEINILLEKTMVLLNNLTEVEKRRFKLNRIYGLTVSEIATLENVSANVVSKSIKKALKKLQEARWV